MEESANKSGVSGRFRSDHDRWLCGLEARIPSAERRFPIIFEHLRPHLQEQVCTCGHPLHLLFLRSRMQPTRPCVPGRASSAHDQMGRRGCPQCLLKVSDGAAEPFVQRYRGLPSRQRARLGDVRAAAVRVIPHRCRSLHQWQIPPRHR